ncbi:hypothetical protein D3C83_176550 [compost metagenome]
MTFRARVALDQIEPFHRNIKFRVLSVVKQHKLAAAWAKIQSLQAAETRDAVVDMDHEVAGPKVPKV